MPCPDVFVQDVPAVLNRKGLAFACYMDPSRPALCDSEHAVRVNYETYLFADGAARDRFSDDVVTYCGLLTDPVTKQRFRPAADSPYHEDEATGVLYYFESVSSFTMFLRMPEDYRLPGYTMDPPALSAPTDESVPAGA